MLSLISIVSLLIISITATDITCELGNDCIIDQNNINSNETNTINARNATTLILKCHQQSCKNAKIQCPNGQCNIICYDEKSCYNAHITTYINTKLTVESLANKSAHNIFITGDNTKEINLSCHADESCENAYIHDPNVENISIFCATRRPYHDSCRLLKIHAENASNVNIICGNEPSDAISGGSCEKAELYIDNANKVNIIAHDIQYGKIKASNANNFNLTCISKWTIHDGCYHTDIWFPNTTENGINTFNCYGSCQLLDIYDIKCDVFNAMNINLNGCDLKHNIYDFINQWSFWYNGKQNAINSFQNALQCGPWQDNQFIQSCNCSDIRDTVSNLFIDDSTMDECDVFYDAVSTTSFPITTTSYYTTTGPTINPTQEPTSNHTQEHTSNPTQEPTSNPTINPTQEPTSNPITSPSINVDFDDKNDEKQMSGAMLALVIILPIGAVLIIIIGLVIFFQKRKSVRETKHQKVKDNDNDEESDYDMENVPIVTHVQMESPNNTY